MILARHRLLPGVPIAKPPIVTTTCLESGTLASPRPCAHPDTTITLRFHRRSLRFERVPPAHPLRARTEACLRAAYTRCHAGAPATLPRDLFALLTDEDEVLATAGLTPGTAPLLSARYLPVPPAELIEGLTCESVAPHELVEIGQLTAIQRGMAPALMVAMAAWLEHSPYRWGIATATAAVRQLLAEMGIAARPLQPARAERLGAAAADYGRYYQADPWIVFGAIADGVAALHERGYPQRMQVQVNAQASAA